MWVPAGNLISQKFVYKKDKIKKIYWTAVIYIQEILYIYSCSIKYLKGDFTETFVNKFVCLKFKLTKR